MCSSDLDPGGGGHTSAKVVEAGDTTLIVKWLEARWDLRNNVMLARKGTKSTVYRSQLV